MKCGGSWDENVPFLIGNTSSEGDVLYVVSIAMLVLPEVNCLNNRAISQISGVGDLKNSASVFGCSDVC